MVICKKGNMFFYTKKTEDGQFYGWTNKENEATKFTEQELRSALSISGMNGLSGIEKIEVN